MIPSHHRGCCHRAGGAASSALAGASDGFSGWLPALARVPNGTPPVRSCLRVRQVEVTEAYSKFVVLPLDLGKRHFEGTPAGGRSGAGSHRLALHTTVPGRGCSALPGGSLPGFDPQGIGHRLGLVSTAFQSWSVPALEK